MAATVLAPGAGMPPPQPPTVGGMPANFAWARADVRDGPTTLHERVHVSVRRDKLTVSTEAGPLLIRQPVLAVRSTGRASFQVELGDGQQPAVLDVVRQGCGCGGGT